MIGLFFLMPILSSASTAYSITSICHATTFGPQNEKFHLDVTRSGSTWTARMYPEGRSSVVPTEIRYDKAIIKILDGVSASDTLFGQVQGHAGDRYYSAILAADIVGGSATNFTVDLVSYSDPGFSKGFARLMSGECVRESGDLKVKDL